MSIDRILYWAIYVGISCVGLACLIMAVVMAYVIYKENQDQ